MLVCVVLLVVCAARAVCDWAKAVQASRPLHTLFRGLKLLLRISGFGLLFILFHLHVFPWSVCTPAVFLLAPCDLGLKTYRKFILPCFTSLWMYPKKANKPLVGFPSFDLTTDLFKKNYNNLMILYRFLFSFTLMFILQVILFSAFINAYVVTFLSVAVKPYDFLSSALAPPPFSLPPSLFLSLPHSSCF